MPIVCINRPNRTSPRHFTLRDVQRISAYVKDEGIDPWIILAFVAAGVGLGVVICKLVTALRAMIRIGNLVRKISDALFDIVVSRFLLRVLSIIAAGAPGRLKLYLIIMIGLLVAAEQWRGTFRDAVSGLDFLESVVENLQRACDAIGQLIPDINEPPDYPAPALPTTIPFRR